MLFGTFLTISLLVGLGFALPVIEKNEKDLDVLPLHVDEGGFNLEEAGLKSVNPGDLDLIEFDEEDLSTDEDSSENEVDSDNDFAIDLSEFGAKIYGSPSKAAGELLANVADLNNTNPEELGPYLEGDVLIPRAEPRSGMRAMSYRWSQGRIPFAITGSFSDAEVDQIYLAIDQYHKYTCLKFEPVQEEDEDYIDFTNDPSGCWASLGRIGGRQQVNIQSRSCTNRLGTVIHEIMHAVGFMHTQNRPDRDEWVEIVYDNIRSGVESNFHKLNGRYVKTFGVPYDYNSVMHYNAYSFSKNGEPTILPLEDTGDVVIGQRKQLSQLDIKSIRNMYKCKGKKSGIP